MNWKSYMEGTEPIFPKIIRVGMKFKINPNSDKRDWGIGVKERAMSNINKIYKIKSLGFYYEFDSNWQVGEEFLKKHFLYIGM
jgi:hypothetical protein